MCLVIWLFFHLYLSCEDALKEHNVEGVRDIFYDHSCLQPHLSKLRAISRNFHLLTV